MSYYAINNNELYHHGIKGQKWGVRRFQNEDGSVTAKGAKRYYDGDISGTGGRSLSSTQKVKKPGLVKGGPEKISINKHIQKGTTPIGNKINAKKAERKQIKENYKNIKKEKMTTGQKLLYGKGTFKKAAKMMEKENMTMDDAVKYSKRRQVGKAALGSALLVGGMVIMNNADKIGAAGDKLGNAYIDLIQERA